MEIKRIAHIAFNVKNIERSLEFYSEKLGFPKIFEMHLQDGRTIDYLKISDTQFIELFYGEGVDTQIPTEKVSYEHFCFEVADVRALREELVSKGIKIDAEPSVGLDNNTQLWISDPDGNRLEFMEYGENALQFNY